MFDIVKVLRYAGYVQSADEIETLRAENERLQRRCEIYASGLTAIANPLPGSTDGVLIRTAINTLRRVEQETS